MLPALALRAKRSGTELKSTVLIDRAVASVAERTGSFVRAHPRSLTAAVMLVLAGFGAAAFGIAPMVPDASDLPKRLVTEIVTPDSIQSQLDALAEHALQLYRTDLTRSSDTADSLLKRLNVNDASAAAFLRTDATARKVLEGRAGKLVRVQTDTIGALTELVARYAASNPDQAVTRFQRLRITRVAGKLLASVETAPLAAQVRIGSGTIRSSLFAATDDARMPDAIATQLAEVFATDIDFHRELRKGDTFSVVYEAMTADGEPITWGASPGKVLAAEFVNNGRSYSAVWFKDGQGKGIYFGLDGQSKRRAFLASPMEFSRVTSGFAMRMHPIQNAWKQHKGVDYGAPAGTPIRAIGDGVVEFAGRQNGYGNVVEIRHNNQRSTLYAHLSRVDVRQGQRVEQGARIGAVGATGWATGPHLHFEVKVGGQQQDPMIMAKASETVALTASGKAEFAQLARSVKGQLDVADSIGRSGFAGE
jgi:murein DD-endopeptidase MepM/ murein hydrolase activator NlpD